MHFFGAAPGLIGFLMLGLVGVGARDFNAQLLGNGIRTIVTRESSVVWHTLAPLSRWRQRNAQTAHRGIKQVINWKAGRLEWVRQEATDEQSILNHRDFYRSISTQTSE